MQYLKDKSQMKSFKTAAYHLASILPHYQGKTFDDLPAISNEIAKDPQAPATNRQRIALLKAACRNAWKRHGWVDHDPTTRMHLPQVNNARQNYPKRRDMLRIARACDNWTARQVVRVLFYSGMRLGELWSGEVVGDVYRLPDTKSGRPRFVPLHPKIQRVAGRILPLTGPKITIQRALERARERAGLKHIRLHDMRHAAASEMLSAGIDLNTVGNVLGHLDPKTTKRYEHLVVEPLHAAVLKIGRRRA